MATKRLPAKEIKTELDSLIQDALSTEPNLAKRLDELRRWIKDKKLGLLTRKPLVIDFLTELILDSRLWLKLKELTSEEKQIFFAQAQMTPAEKYWYEFLFPQWFNESDPKLDTWKKKMMSGEFTQEDEELINNLADEIEINGGACLWRYIIDLSMATDLVTSGNSSIPLCVQMTISSEEWLTDKKVNWEATLRYWGITRGLLVSINPQNLADNLNSLANVILQKCDSLPSSCYDELIY